MTDHEDEAFQLALVDFKLLLHEYGVGFVFQELERVYPDTYKQVAKHFHKEEVTKKVPALFRRKV